MRNQERPTVDSRRGVLCVSRFGVAWRERQIRVDEINLTW